MKVKEARQAGKISTGNTKMPGTTFAIDAFACITGSKLAKIEGTPCASCYARRLQNCLLYTSPSPRDLSTSRMPSSA